MNNEYTSPHDLSRVKFTEHMVIPEETQLDCVCPFCRGRSFSYFRDLPYQDRAMLFRCHNYWVTERTAADLYRNAKSVNLLRKYLVNRTTRLNEVEELCLALSLVDDFKDRDLRYLDDKNVGSARPERFAEKYEQIYTTT